MDQLPKTRKETLERVKVIDQSLIKNRGENARDEAKREAILNKPKYEIQHEEPAPPANLPVATMPEAKVSALTATIAEMESERNFKTFKADFVEPKIRAALTSDPAISQVNTINIQSNREVINVDMEIVLKGQEMVKPSRIGLVLRSVDGKIESKFRNTKSKFKEEADMFVDKSAIPKILDVFNHIGENEKQEVEGIKIINGKLRVTFQSKKPGRRVATAKKMENQEESWTEEDEAMLQKVLGEIESMETRLKEIDEKEKLDIAKSVKNNLERSAGNERLSVETIPYELLKEKITELLKDKASEDVEDVKSIQLEGLDDKISFNIRTSINGTLRRKPIKGFADITGVLQNGGQSNDVEIKVYNVETGIALKGLLTPSMVSVRLKKLTRELRKEPANGRKIESMKIEGGKLKVTFKK